MDTSEPERPGLLDTLRRMANTVLAMVQNRLELLLIELQEERIRILNAVVLLAISVALGFFTLATAAIAVLLILWNFLGISGLFIASGCGLIATSLVIWRLQVRFKNWPFLAGTLAELKKDSEWLKPKS